MSEYSAAVAHLLALGHELQAGKFFLEGIRVLAAELGHPELASPSVLVAGTNGKGSTCAMLEAVLRAAGYHAGLYTSPHLARINERIRVDGADIGDSAFAAAFDTVQAAVERLLASGALPKHPSFFECITAMAWEHFRAASVEVQVLEVGMGGRLDATNIAAPVVTAITPVSLDHEAYLGSTVVQIAGEKAGIIRAGAPVVIAAQPPEAERVIRGVAAEAGARVVRAAELLPRAAGYELSLRGEHQIGNAATALTVIEELCALGWRIPETAVREGLRAARWPGRLEKAGERPAIYLDGAHNPAGMQVLRTFAETTSHPRVLVFGAMRDKAVAEMAEILFPAMDAIVLTRPEQRRAASPETLRDVTSHLSELIYLRPAPAEALELAIRMAGRDGTVLVAGSLFLVGDLKRLELVAQG
jgi:dihydrofolate synthase/folylpolyglutamate synthase